MWVVEVRRVTLPLPLETNRNSTHTHTQRPPEGPQVLLPTHVTLRPPTEQESVLSHLSHSQVQNEKLLTGTESRVASTKVFTSGCPNG